MKPIEGYNKLRGGYYTPKKIAEFIATWAIRTKNDEILLHQGLGLTTHEVELLHNIWIKMKGRRLSRKNRKG